MSGHCFVCQQAFKIAVQEHEHSASRAYPAILRLQVKGMTWLKERVNDAAQESVVERDTDHNDLQVALSSNGSRAWWCTGAAYVITPLLSTAPSTLSRIFFIAAWMPYHDSSPGTAF